MEKSDVDMRYLVCKNMGGLCAFLANENINEGSTTSLEMALSLEENPYLERLVDNRLGSAFNTCIAHQIIVKAAKKVLESRHG